MKRIYVCRSELKDRVYVIEDVQMTLFNEEYAFTVHFGRRHKWERSKLIRCKSLSDKQKKIAEIDRKRRRHGYSLEESQK